MEVQRKGKGPGDSADATFAANCIAMTPYLERFLLSRGITASDVPDLVQEAFLVLWQRRDDIEPGKTKAFLTQTAYNLCLNHRRNLKKHTTIHQDHQNAIIHALHQGQHAAPQISAKLQQVEQRQYLANLIAQLPPRQRAVLELIYLHGMDRKKTAEKLSYPIGSLYNAERQGLRSLKNQLKDEESEKDFEVD